MRFITRNKLRVVAGMGVSLALGLLAACGSSSSSDSGENGTPVTGTFIDAPVQGLSYKVGGWTAQETKRKWTSIASSADGTKLAAVHEKGISTSTDSGLTWTAHKVSPSSDWRAIASSADGNKLAAVMEGGYVYTWSKGDASWTEHQSPGRRTWAAVSMSADGTRIAVASSGGIFSGKLYVSTDSGASWTKAFSRDKPWRSVAWSADGTKLAAVAAGAEAPEEIFTSVFPTNSNPTATDIENSWTKRDQAGKKNWRSIASSVDGKKLATVVGGGKIYTSTDGGTNWTERGSDDGWFSITSSSDGTKLAAVNYNGRVFTSSDSGVTWTAVQSSRKWASITSSADGSKLAAVTWGEFIYTYSPPITKLTTAAGKYDCAIGEDVTFSLGNQVLGAVKCGEAVHVYHMAGTGNTEEKGVRVARLLQSLNTSTNTSKITLPDLTGIDVSVPLDTNDTDFEKGVAALMAQLRNQGKALVNTTPVTRAAAVAHVQTELAKLGDDQKTNLCSVNACNSELLAKLVKPAAVKVAVSGLPIGQAIDLQLAISGSNTKSTLKLEGAAGNLSAGFASVPVSGQTYTVSRTDSNAGIGCTLSNQTGTYDPLNAPTVTLSCSVNTKATTTLKGTVTGLASGQSVSLKNNEGTESLSISSNGSFQWGTAIAAGATYKLVVASQNPANLVCTVINGAGTAPVDVYSPSTSEVTNIAVDCKQIGYGVAGKVTGLTSDYSLGLKLTSSDANANGQTVNVVGTAGPSGSTYVFFNAPIASGKTFSIALDGEVTAKEGVVSPVSFTCTVQRYTSATPISSNIENADVDCSPTSAGENNGGGGSPSVTSVTPNTAMVGSPALFAITGSNLPTTAILVLGGVECTSSMSASNGFAATCPAPSSAGQTNAQVKTNTTANSGANIGNSVTITVADSGGGGGGGINVTPGTYTPGSVNGQVTNNGPDTRTILIVNGSNQVSATVNSNSTASFTLPGQLNEGVAYTVTASDVTSPTPGGGLLNCTVSNGTGSMVALPNAVSNVSVTCQIAGPGSGDQILPSM